MARPGTLSAEDREILSKLVQEADRQIFNLYDHIRILKQAGASYRQLVEATGIPHATIQLIVAGKNPGFSLPKD